MGVISENVVLSNLTLHPISLSLSFLVPGVGVISENVVLSNRQPKPEKTTAGRKKDLIGQDFKSDWSDFLI